MVMPPPATQKDVAERLGLSVSAVSKALSGAPDIGSETLLAVEAAAAEMGYVPNAAARQLKLQRTDSVGVILPATGDLRPSDAFFAEFLTGLVEQLNEYGLGVLLSTAHADGDEDTYLKQIQSRKVDGFVIVRAMVDDPRIALLAARGIPFVSFGRANGSDTHAYVDEDGASATESLVDLLVELGHSRFACIAEPSGYSRGDDRLRGFLSGLAKHGITTERGSVVEAGYRRQAGFDVANHILSRKEPPTAIVCSNDLLAHGAMRAAQRRGLTVGSDVSITGFDDIALAEFANPSLTTVRSGAAHSGRVAADIVGRSIRGLPVEDPQVRLDLELVVRDSTGPPRSRQRD